MCGHGCILYRRERRPSSSPIAPEQVRWRMGQFDELAAPLSSQAVPGHPGRGDICVMGIVLASEPMQVERPETPSSSTWADMGLPWGKFRLGSRASGSSGRPLFEALGCNSVGWHLWLSRTCSTLLQDPLDFKVCTKESCYSDGFSFICDVILSLVSLRTHTLLRIFGVLTVVRCGEFLFWSWLFGILCDSCIWMAVDQISSIWGNFLLWTCWRYGSGNWPVLPSPSSRSILSIWIF